ncbi:anti-phage protein Ppl [Pseudoalteromonas arabiensis]|uniref:anti-phage protein Ppl n=1 Tax=Pseudoalteromonas arabiensis TaxID=874454 RepID=UPI000785BF14|nr:anti-phage protein Ppl [Pseudoalteromonas arabiensis]
MPVGSKWFKFDFHNHTIASDDYQEHSLTDRDWLLAYMAREVDAVIISDHNTASKIESIRNELSQMKSEFEQDGLDGYRPITIFPGVELTATGNVHVLAIFEQNTTHIEIERLIGFCNGSNPIPRDAQNHELVLRSSVPEIISFINNDPNCLSILAHVDGRKGALEITNEGELRAIFEASPNAVEICGELDEIHNGLHQSLISELPKVRGSDAHHPERAGTRTCWLKMSMLNFDGLKSALQDYKNCILLDSEPPREPLLRIKSLKLKTRLCRSELGEPIEIEFSPFYNALIGSRGSGKSTIVESIRIALRKENGLPSSVSENLRKFKSIDNGMDLNSIIECVYSKNGTDFKFSWAPNIEPTLEKLTDGEWEVDSNWSNDRFDLSIFSQKMLYLLASDQNAFLKVCDDSSFVDKRSWTERKEELERDYKSNRNTYRGLLSRKITKSALEGQLSDAISSIDKLKDSPYYSVRTNLSELEKKLFLIENKIAKENESLDSISELFTSVEDQISDQAPELEATNSAMPAAEEGNDTEYLALTAEIDSVIKDAENKFSEIISNTRSRLEELSQSPFVQELTQQIKQAKAEVQIEADKLKEEGLDPEQLDSLVEHKDSLEAKLIDFDGIDDEIQTSVLGAESIKTAMADHRRTLTNQRKEFIRSLSLESLDIKILPLNANPQQVIESYQSTVGIPSFSDRIYDTESRDGLLKELIEFQTFNPSEATVNSKYERLDNLKEIHNKIKTGETDGVPNIHGSLRSRLASLTEADIDNLACWYPEDGIQIKYRALSGNMENIESASPGQKAASMLEFLLSYGSDPLILDQPEDDLDCLMLSDSVIPSIERNKQRRQLIIVSHSAPIVVNGDAEYVISMLRDRSGLRPNILGSLQESEVKTNICNQMEGGERAFRSRFNRIVN